MAAVCLAQAHGLRQRRKGGITLQSVHQKLFILEFSTLKGNLLTHIFPVLFSQTYARNFCTKRETNGHISIQQFEMRFPCRAFTSKGALPVKTAFNASCLTRVLRRCDCIVGAIHSPTPVAPLSVNSIQSHVFVYESAKGLFRKLFRIRVQLRHFNIADLIKNALLQ